MTEVRPDGNEPERDSVHTYESMSAAQVLQARYRSRLPDRRSMRAH
ncbi:hypothetical protein ACGFZB_38100 [Streptomyces cinerochromogenes]|uniref:Uncharacterized protein n=1 Tax=Streptomyces cinerochromogenes TaxID=66422 RepID=A0ABW7BGD2_9ACTN